MAEPARATSPRRVFWAVLAGTLLLELAWVLALPAFRGADEFDHAYKADAVAHGQLRGTVEAQDGRGQLLAVDSALVDAAGPLCSSYPYTGPDNCTPVAASDPGRVLVASAAASYNPTFYVVAGTVAAPFEGVSALMAMRVATAVLTSLLLATSALVITRWATTSWPLLALAVACTPVLVQSAGVAAPNAVGYAAGCLVWAAATGLVRRPSDPGWWAPLLLGSCTVLVTHTTGMLWGVCIVLVVLSLRSRGEWLALARHHHRALLRTVLGSGLVASACLGWVLVADTNRLGAPSPAMPPMDAAGLASSQLAWLLQTVAAFPLRNEMAPVWIYPVWLGLLGTVAWLGARAAERRTRVSLLLVALLWVAVPLALTAASYASEGYAWQGRYALPLAVGIPALCGLALDRRGAAPPRAAAAAAVVLMALAHVSSVVDVAWTERGSGWPGTAAAAPGGLATTVLLAVAGVSVVVWGTTRRRDAAPSSPTRVRAREVVA